MMKKFTYNRYYSKKIFSINEYLWILMIFNLYHFHLLLFFSSCSSISIYLSVYLLYVILSSRSFYLLLPFSLPFLSSYNNLSGIFGLTFKRNSFLIRKWIKNLIILNSIYLSVMEFHQYTYCTKKDSNYVIHVTINQIWLYLFSNKIIYFFSFPNLKKKKKSI